MKNGFKHALFVYIGMFVLLHVIGAVLPFLKPLIYIALFLVPFYLGWASAEDETTAGSAFVNGGIVAGVSGALFSFIEFIWVSKWIIFIFSFIGLAAIPFWLSIPFTVLTFMGHFLFGGIGGAIRIAFEK
ncbi:hypothetical protein D9V86_10010 [Bacteroidetes/Chlorobi group bacterium ChocPot_Mid]|nr:MAG: hypothetical protein D9V86_10010 [Bacteroidetes/Chlorobi group bacterium ChocPot_Mid]